MIYLTSDWHFNHNKEFIYKERGFNTVEEMNQAILKQYNEIVASDDTVYVLGDCLLGPIEGVQLLSQLNGHKILVAGNHCTDNRLAAYDKDHIFEYSRLAIRFRYQSYSFYLSHYPTLTANYDDGEKMCEKVINLCGHTHTKDKFYHMRQGLMCYNVGVDAHGLKPVALNDIIKDIKEYK